MPLFAAVKWLAAVQQPVCAAGEGMGICMPMRLPVQTPSPGDAVTRIDAGQRMGSLSSSSRAFPCSVISTFKGVP